MATHAPNAIGFPALLNEMLKRTHCTFRPEYAVYARGYEVCMVDYMATLHLEATMVVDRKPMTFKLGGSYRIDPTHLAMEFMGTVTTALTGLESYKQKAANAATDYGFHMAITKIPSGMTRLQREMEVTGSILLSFSWHNKRVPGLMFMQFLQETGKISVTDYVRVTSTEW
ncbi:hypothetical protein C2845_PM07G10520 [Panicum miliaceum]|uniref:Uncharacterized protein n=1 Tax=Panicum miliaceum TaxID=4540 RepID=A0A3L6SMI4_PANMI|nr:hypothetical protein C2845_PM07G10520 [Panicum miliaceum]